MQISVIIATTCEKRRESQIRRAIASVLTQKAVEVELIVVVNGDNFDRALYDELLSRSDLRVHYQDLGSFPAEVRTGRLLSTAPFFCFLDDDDEYLEDALAVRLEAIHGDPAIDFVATNGWVELDGSVRQMVRNAAEIQQQPLRTSLSANWLGSSAALFRSATVGAEFFDGVTKHFEWTWLTWQLLHAGRRVRFVDKPTFHKYDTPESLSKLRTLDVRLTELAILRRLALMVELPEHRKVVRRRKSSCYHELAGAYLARGDRRRALAANFRSLLHPSGIAHLKFTLRVLTPWRRADSTASGRPRQSPDNGRLSTES